MALSKVLKLQESILKFFVVIISAKTVRVSRHAVVLPLFTMAAISPLCENSSHGTKREMQKCRTEEAWERETNGNHLGGEMD